MFARCRTASVFAVVWMRMPYWSSSGRPGAHISQPTPWMSWSQFSGHRGFIRGCPPRSTRRRTRGDRLRRCRWLLAGCAPGRRSRRARSRPRARRAEDRAGVLLPASASSPGRPRCRGRTDVRATRSVRPAPRAGRPETPASCRPQSRAGSSWSRAQRAFRREAVGAGRAETTANATKVGRARRMPAAALRAGAPRPFAVGVLALAPGVSEPDRWDARLEVALRAYKYGYFLLDVIEVEPRPGDPTYLVIEELATRT